MTLLRILITVSWTDTAILQLCKTFYIHNSSWHELNASAIGVLLQRYSHFYVAGTVAHLLQDGKFSGKVTFLFYTFKSDLPGSNSFLVYVGTLCSVLCLKLTIVQFNFA